MKRITLLAFSLLLLTACNTTSEESTENINEENILETETEAFMEQLYLAELEDVTGGDAIGLATATYGEAYTLIASFENLPELEEGYFYEGWVVRNDPLSVVSTGELNGSENVYADADDLTDHTQYVLTIEPDDGDPAPADHVLQGTFNQL
jgi:hypothetical protein